jgi:hypothetical protein
MRVRRRKPRLRRSFALPEPGLPRQPATYLNGYWLMVPAVFAPKKGLWPSGPETAAKMHAIARAFAIGDRANCYIPSNLLLSISRACWVQIRLKESRSVGKYSFSTVVAALRLANPIKTVPTGF